MSDANACRRRGARRLDAGRHQHASMPGEMVTLTYTPTAAQQVSGIQQDFRGANNYRPERQRRSAGAGGRAQHQQLVEPHHRDGADRPEPAVRQRARATACAGRCAGRSTWWLSKRFDMPWRATAAFEFRVEVFNLLNRTNFRAPERQPQRGRLRHDHDDIRSADHPVRIQGEFLDGRSDHGGTENF